MNYQLLALDLDGTLTNSQKEISPATAEALIAIQKQGKKVVLASGRPPQGVFPLARLLRLDDFGSYIICFNGGRIIDCRNNEIIYNRLLAPASLKPIYQLACQYDVDILAYTDTRLISGHCFNQHSKLESDINQLPVFYAKNFSEFAGQPNNKFLITGEPPVIHELETAFQKKFRSALNVYCSGHCFLEIMPPQIDKAHSLQKLVSSIGLSAEEVICCGDGHNDIAMIEYAGLGVAMENALPLVLERADYVTKSNDNDGILHVIKEFMSNEKEK